MQQRFAEHGLVISAGKMSGLWSGQPMTLKLSDLDVICVALDCQVGDLLIAEPDTVTRPGQDAAGKPAADATVASDIRRVVPRRRDGRSLPPR
ncbi:helix-turn-helix domain-containing protein [Couchioplanes caeruleus]|uniref:helix-turn-helix domain-containing protein n=1 Tax=Couchioplanes caeruleus TaxID=56438 RepID=UPI000AEC9D88|nr:helix-turn-helix transcriptional regulator [Couchioplanes caeruleus]